MPSADVFLTGGTGFIGKHFLKQLTGLGRDVRCMVRKTSRIDGISKFKCEIVNADLNNIDSLTWAIANCKTVFHVAGKARNVTRGGLLQTNCEGTRNLAIACLRQPNPPTMIFLSSLAAAGPSQLNQPRVESDPCEPVSEYGHSKLAAESSLRDLSDDLAISVIRPPIVFGEEDTVTLDLFSAIKKFGLYVRPGYSEKQYSLIHADDLVQSALAIESNGRRLAKDNLARGIYYSAFPKELSAEELAESIGETVSRRPLTIPVPNFGVKVVAALNEAISAVTPWKPFVNWDKAREVTAGSWTCSASKLLQQTEVKFESLESRLAQTAEGYRRKGWL
ncbi:NAD-dependent epimerase/dehydratase family protein [Mariniblastus fucicola]|uniref:dTDP-6-deoxy-L-talose 4-dehydrogenase (NAD(P)(+)) n=1 Tax=Mariniblastus fucicola TaxID=980251 RepID=A0A5B9P373_9BACT|nr:NAD-dependent epimerase/dehydratase family protein [Mariniblastus fucicola]QEG20624.1 dTDP-6-deoxy-L-talose 4-dehydrogenase (NAD(P)(+)) [Mariniblastus fucicola]